VHDLPYMKVRSWTVGLNTHMPLWFGMNFLFLTVL